ncbi:MAG: hypothetical protein ACK5UA_11775 [Cereibacter sp.]
MTFRERNVILIFMQTVREGHKWLTKALGGDAPRANSLLKVGQTTGLLTTLGRGRGSPWLTLTDFAALVGMALMTEGPTKAPQAVGRLWGLSLASITVDPGDGLDRTITSYAAYRDQLDPILSPYFGMMGILHFNVVDNLIGALTSLFTIYAPATDFGRYDLVTMQEAGDSLSVTITLHGPRYGLQPDGYTGEGDDAYRVSLTFGDTFVFSQEAVETRRTIRAAALNGLAALTRQKAVA